MQVGSIVKTVTNFDDVRNEWKLNYPHYGDILTVSDIQPHPNEEMHRIGAVLLSFEEKPDLPGISDIKIDKEPNFIELLPPMDISALLEIPESATV